MNKMLSDESHLVKIEVSSRGKRLRTPVVVNIPRAERPGEQAVIDYVIEAFTKKMPRLIKFTFENKTTLNVAKYLLRHKTGSHQTLYQYIYSIDRFCKSINEKPDDLIQKCKTNAGLQDQQQTQIVIQQIDDFIGDLQADKLAPGTIGNYVKGVKCLFRRNGLSLELPFNFSKRVKYRDRAPTPEELQKLVEIADIREKVIISVLGLSGMRIGTLVKLEYRHVMKDLESGTTSICLHIESDIVKGKYGDYETFLGYEAVNYLKTYLEIRERGTRKIPPETLLPNSPLVRNARNHIPTPITESQVHRIVNKLYKKAGIIGQTTSRRYRVRPHSIRKYFKTQMMALGTINSDYIDYMMGHVTDTYNDIQGLGKEHLRNVYASSGLSIRPKTELNKIETIKALAITLGLDPDVILSKVALQKPHRTIIDGAYQTGNSVKILSKAIKTTLIEELRNSNNGVWTVVARERFELSSGGFSGPQPPEPPILDR